MLRLLLHQTKLGKDKISAMMKKLQCVIQLDDLNAITCACQEYASLVDSVQSGRESMKQTTLDEFDNKISEYVKKIGNPEAKAQLIQCRFSLLKHHKNPKTRLFRLGSLGRSMEPIAREMSSTDLKEEFKKQYKVLDDILCEMQKIGEVDNKERCKQVTWYLTQYGLCCTAIRDLKKSIIIHHKAIGIMEFVFSDEEVARDKVYGHCHSNHGSAYELSEDLEEALDSYQKALNAYSKVTEKWKNEEKHKTMEKIKEYIERVESKIKQKKDSN